MHISMPALLAQQLLCCLSLLLALGKCCGLDRPPPLRALVSSMLGSVMTALGFLHPHPLMRWVMLAILPGLPALAWPGLPRSQVLRLIVPQWLLSLCFAGAARMLDNLLPAPLALPAACGLMLCCPALLRRSPETTCARLCIRLGTSAVTCTALVDSGNLLRDAVTGLPIIVLSRSTARQLTQLPQPGGPLMPGMRYLPIRTVSGPTAMVVLRADSIRLTAHGATTTVQALLGIAPHPAASFSALAPASLIPHKTR